MGSQSPTGISSIARAHTYWNPPQSTFAKLNFDGSSRGNPGDSWVGICLRKHLGEMSENKSSALSPRTNNMEKPQALLIGLSLANKI
ncbi:hypothetical protein SUGI_0390970 [Cryptomeria japonica]|nr:hypothetical protein SUGI_0390970 [Cryptomeria japonica]